jgi:hypothetical protein
MNEIKIEGREKLWLWFELSYASFLTLPRVLMHEMPDEWQGKMADLLNEYSEAFPNQPDIGSRVQITDMSGKLIPCPEWLKNYRHPDQRAVDNLRSYSQSN